MCSVERYKSEALHEAQLEVRYEYGTETSVKADHNCSLNRRDESEGSVFSNFDDALSSYKPIFSVAQRLLITKTTVTG